HDSVHARMDTVEHNGSIHITWCNHLWQGAYHLLEFPGQWYLVAGLARQLLEHRALTGAEAERYLSIARERLKRDPEIPNAVLVCEVTPVCSPWHREWHQKSIVTTRKPKGTKLTRTIAGLSARADV